MMEEEYSNELKRIVLFSDVHGNITGLRAVLDEAARLENVTQIIGLGDYFGYGAGCDDIIELCQERNVRLNDNCDLIGFHAAYRDMEANICATDRSLETLEAAYGNLEENIVVYGHYHEPHVIPLKDKLLINCASVGMRKKDNKSNYTVIEYDDEKIAIIQRQVCYDKAEEDRLVKERGMMRRTQTD